MSGVKAGDMGPATSSSTTERLPLQPHRRWRSLPTAPLPWHSAAAFRRYDPQIHSGPNS